MSTVIHEQKAPEVRSITGLAASQIELALSLLEENRRKLGQLQPVSDPEQLELFRASSKS